MNIELNFPPNFEGLVLGCIDADFCKQILVGISYTRWKALDEIYNIFSSSYFCTSQTSKFQQIRLNLFAFF